MRVIIAGDPPPLPRLLGATGRGTAMRPSDVTDVLSLPRSQEMLDRDICRLAYVAIDGTPAATEFVGGSISSLGVKETLSPVPVENLEAAIVANDPHMIYADFDRRGYGVLTLDKDRATVEYKAADALTEGAPTEPLASFELPVGSLDVQRTD